MRKRIEQAEREDIGHWTKRIVPLLLWSTYFGTTGWFPFDPTLEPNSPGHHTPPAGADGWDWQPRWR